MGVINTAGKLIWCSCRIYPPPISIFNPSLRGSFSKPEKMSAHPSTLPHPPPPPIQLFLYFSGLLLSCISFGLHALAVSLLCSPFCISHKHLIHLTCSPQLSASFSSSTAPPGVSAPEQYFFFLHNHCWWGFHFEHLLISHFFSLPSLIKAVRFYWCQLCLHINDLFVCPPQQVWLIEQDYFFWGSIYHDTFFLALPPNNN